MNKIAKSKVMNKIVKKKERASEMPVIAGLKKIPRGSDALLQLKNRIYVTNKKEKIKTDKNGCSLRKAIIMEN
jgi:hypothetical protein